MAVEGARGPWFGHVRGLDGLRGLAVLAVVAYHNEFAWASGGFLGVSLFFTLSGFLITSLLLTDAERLSKTGTAGQTGQSSRASRASQAGIELTDFWRRRFRRLLPASLIAIIGAALFTVTSGTNDQLSRFDNDALASLGYIFNWRQVTTQAGYTGASSDPSALQHFWSLAIEEQFYILFPLIFAGIHLVRRGSRDSAATLLGLGAVALMAVSFIATFALGGANAADRVYFGTDTRMFEILAGVAAAVIVMRFRETFQSPANGRKLSAAAAVALAALAWWSSTASTVSGWLYDGGFALISFVSVVAIVGTISKGPLERMLATPPLVFTGKISYGLYLYHWPIFLWLTPLRTGIDNSWVLFGLRLAVSFAAATLSYRLVEQPIRAGAMAALSPRRFLAGATAAVAVVAAIAIGTGSVERPDAGDLIASITAAPSADAATVPQQTAAPSVGEAPTIESEPEVAGATQTRNDEAQPLSAIIDPSQFHGPVVPAALADSDTAGRNQSVEDETAVTGDSENDTTTNSNGTGEARLGDAESTEEISPESADPPATTTSAAPTTTSASTTTSSSSTTSAPTTTTTIPPTTATTAAPPPSTTEPERATPRPTAPAPTTTLPPATSTTVAPTTLPPTTTAPPQPVSAERVLVLGDSLSHDLFPFLSEALNQRGIASQVIGGPSEGPLEADVPWLDELRSSLASFNPDLVVFQSCCFGRRAVGSGPELRSIDGNVVEPDSPEMFAAHDQLTRIMADEIRNSGARMVMVRVPISDPNPFYGPLPERMASFQRDYDRLRAEQPWIEEIDWNPILAPAGVFSWTGTDHNGNTVEFRKADGLHLTDIANALVAVAVADYLATPVPVSQ